MEITEALVTVFRGSLLADHMTADEARDFLSSSCVQLIEYGKGEIIFHDGDLPRFLYVLISGMVHIQKDSFSGRHICLSEINEPGDVFGEVYLLMEKNYDMYVEAVQETKILAIRSESFSLSGETEPASSRLVQRNLMRILARKAYLMHSKLKIMASGSLRERILRFLFWNIQDGDRIRLRFTREAWAGYLAAARPSLSRELSALQEEGILKVKGKEIVIMDKDKFETYL